MEKTNEEELSLSMSLGTKLGIDVVEGAETDIIKEGGQKPRTSKIQWEDRLEAQR